MSILLKQWVAGMASGVNWSSYWSPLNFVIEGHSFAINDSLEAFANDTINYAYTATPATGGATMSILEGRAATTDALIRSGHRNIMMLWIGANDIQAEGDGAVFYAALKSYVQDRIVAGWTIFAYTTTPVNDARAVMFEVERDVSNGLMRSDLALLDRVYILDTDTISELDDPSDQLYYSGEVHLSFLGHWLANGLFRTSLNTASSGAAVKAEETPIDLTITPTGTGAGIARIDPFSTSEYTVIQLVGNARFYTDAAATLGECDYLVIGATQYAVTRYIKTNGGESTFRIIRDRLAQIDNWISSTNAPSLSGSLTPINKSITNFTITGNNAVTIDITDFINLTELVIAGGANASGSITLLVKITNLNLSCTTNTVGGSLTNLVDLLTAFFSGSNTIGGIINGLTKLTSIEGRGNTEVGGDPGLMVSASLIKFYWLTSRFTEYTEGATWGNANITIITAVGYGLNQSEQANLLIDVNNSAGGSSGKAITLAGSNASMSDTTQGGIWGNFDGETSPSALATAYKSLIRTKSNTLVLLGITVPGVSGDGTGFPAGFGDWYRS